jgi:hypothetical protein
VIGDISEIMDAQLFKDTFLIAEKDVKIEKITELQNENEKLKEIGNKNQKIENTNQKIENTKKEKNNTRKEKNNTKEEIEEKEFNTLYKNYKNVANILS